MIDYQLLAALYEIINEQSFERAAKKLFITQSAISRRIQSLESLLGEPVLIRTKPPQPTAKGQRLLSHFQQVMQLELALGIDALNDNETQSEPIGIRLAANSDSLATWLPQALSGMNAPDSQPVKFELVVDDQTVVLKKMKAGEVMACVSSESKPINGGQVNLLGYLRYRPVASPAFIREYNIDSIEALAACPCLIFDDNDKLQHQFLSDVLDISTALMHKIPCPEGFKQAIIAGVGYGMLPELQFQEAISNNELVLLDEKYVIDVPLYWHSWQTESPQLKTLRARALAVAKQLLLQDVEKSADCYKRRPMKLGLDAFP